MNKKIIGPANNLSGYLIRCADHKFRLRTTDTNGNFDDLEILHSDMTIRIEDDEVFIYENENGDRWLDHSPATLGIKK